MSIQIIEGFYQSFQHHDHHQMVALYHPEIIFSDPVFESLNYNEVSAMWKMLLDRSRGELEIDFHSVHADTEKAQCIWEAKYVFSKTKRPVHNVIQASMEFKDGLIIQHIDEFSFWRWSAMALGLPGIFLGWTPMIQQNVRKKARYALDQFLKKQ